MFSLRIVNVDSYQNAPSKGYDICYSEFRGCEIYKVPIIRIFGITPAGQKGCLHVHGVFPYFSIRCKDVFPNVEAKSLRKCMQELALDIDKALNVASRNSSSHRHHVYKIVVTEHIPFYGYHEKAEEFLKIYFYNPFDVNRTAELMTNGVILNKFIQPYEAHIPYILQFFIDYNLFGMNLIHVSKFKFRASEDDLVSAASPLRNQTLFHVLDDSSSPSNKIWRIGALSSSQISCLPRQTFCELEADCCSSEIMNRLNESSSSGKNPGLLAIWEEERQRRKAENDCSLITPVPSQERADFIETESENFYKKKLRKILESFDVYKVCQKDKGSEESSPSISDLCSISKGCCLSSSSVKEMGRSQTGNNHASKSQSLTSASNGSTSTQDEEMLNLMLSLINNHSTQLDDDSILGFNHENDIQNENVDEEETLEMSQLFTGELEEMWSSQALHSVSDQCRINSNFDCTLMEQSEASSEDITIPQLDGAFDEDIDVDHKHSKKKKEKATMAISEESLIKSCTLFQPVVRLSPTIFIKSEIYSPAESKPESDFLSECMDDNSSFSTPKSPSLPICVPVSKNAHCSLVMNIYENSNDVSIEHTCSSRNFAQYDSLADAEDPSNIVFEILTNLIYKVECLTEGRVSCYEHLTEEYCGESCSSALFQALSPEEKKILRHIKTVPYDFKETPEHHVNKRESHVDPHLSLPIKKRIFNNSWNRDEFSQCDTCSHSLSLDLSKIGKEIVLVKKLSESDFLNHIKFNTLKVVIPPLPLNLQSSDKFTPSLKNDVTDIKPTSPTHKNYSDFLSKKSFKSKNNNCCNKEKHLATETKFGLDNFNSYNSFITKEPFCKLSSKKNDSNDSSEKLKNVLFLPTEYMNNESSQSSGSKMIYEADNKISGSIDSNYHPNLESNSNSEISVECSLSGNVSNEENSKESKINSEIPVIPDSFEPEIIPDSLNFLSSPAHMDSNSNENKEYSEIVVSNSNSEISLSLENSKIACNTTTSENTEHEVVHDNYSFAEEKEANLVSSNKDVLNSVHDKNEQPSNSDNKIDNVIQASDKPNNSSDVERKTTVFLSELRLYRRKKTSLMNQHHSPIVSSDLGNESDDYHSSNIEENNASIGSRVREKNYCDLEVEYIGTTDKSKQENFNPGIPVVQLEPCKELIEKYCKNETDIDCLILKEVTHEQKTPPTVKEKRFFRSRGRQSKELNFSSNLIINHKLGINGPKYTTNTFLPPNRGRRNSLSNFSIRKTIRPVLRRRSVNFDTPDKKKLQTSLDFTNSSLLSEKHSIEQVYDFESPLNSAENDLDNNYFSRYSLKNKSTNSLRRNISNKLSLKLNRRRNKDAQDDYVPRHVTIDTDSQKIIRPKRTLSVVSYNEEEDHPIEENQIVMKRFRRNNLIKDIQRLPEIENSVPEDTYSGGDSNEISDWSIDDDPVLQFRSREALKCIISKKKIKLYTSHKSEKLPIPKFKVRKKKKSNPLNVNIKLVKSSSDYFNNDDSDFQKGDSYYCISPKKKKHSKKSKKKSRTFASALDVKQKYKKHKESRNECLKNAILQYCSSVAKNKNSKLSAYLKHNDQETFKSEEINTFNSPSLTPNFNVLTPKNDDLVVLNSSSLAEDNSEETRRTKNSLKMKLKLKRITTRSNEERIVVVDKELEGIDTESDDETKDESASIENISYTKPENYNEICEKQKHSHKTLGTRSIKCDLNDLKLKAKFKCPLLTDNKKPEKSLSYNEENLNMENYKDKIPKFKYKPLLANISKDLVSESECNITNSFVKDASPDKVMVVSPKKKSPFKNADSIKKELAQLNEMAYETKAHSNAYKAISKTSSEISLMDYHSQKRAYAEEITPRANDNILLSSQYKLQERKLSNSKISSHKNSVFSPNFKKYFDNNDMEEISHCENQENVSSVSSDLSVNCKPFVIDLKKMSSLEIEKYIHKSIMKPETVCDPVVASFPSPIVDSKSTDPYIDPKKIFENLFTFSSPSHSHSPLHLNTFETSSLMIENDMSCGPFSNDSSEHSRKEVPKTNLNAQNPLKPNDVFKSVERDDMGVLWNLAYFSPPQTKIQDKTASFNAPFDRKTKSYHNQKDKLSFNDLQKLVKQTNENSSLSGILMESESENSIIALNAKNVEANSKNDVYSRESKISFENILDKNINKVLDDLESIPSFSKTPTQFEVEQIMSNKSESCEADLETSTVIKEEPKSDPVFKPEDSEPVTEETLPNVRILDFQECLVESDSEMNPLLNDSEIDSVISSADMILSNGMDSQSYEHCLQTDLTTDSRNSIVESKLKLVSEESKNLEIEDTFTKTDIDSNLQKHIDSDLTCNNAIITAADTSSVLIPSYKNNTIPVLAINNPCQEATVNFATFDEQNLNTNGQFLPVMLASVSVAENASYVDDSAIVIKENEPNPPECMNFLEDNELLQSCSVSSTSDIENKNMQASNTLGIPFNGEEDILSMIVKSCDIGEEFDGNMNSIEETEGESISSATLCDNMIDSNYVMPGSNFIISSQPDQNSFQANSENAVSSSSENNLIQKNSEIVVIKTEPVDIPEVEQVVYELRDKNLNVNPPCKNMKTTEELGPDNVLLDTMIHSFYGDNSLYGIHSSGNTDNISLLCPTFQNTSVSQVNEGIASGCSPASLRSSVMRTADNALDTYKSDGYFRNISIHENDSYQLKSTVSNDKVSLGVLKNSFYVAHSSPKVSSKRYHFIPSIRPPTREFIENSLIKKEIGDDVKLKTAVEDSLSSNSSPSSQISACDEIVPNVFKKSTSEEKEISGSQNSQSSTKNASHHDVKVSISSPVLYHDRNKSIFSFTHHLSSTPSTSHTKNEFILSDVVVSPINKETELIPDTSKRKRKLMFEDDSDGPVKILKSSREKICNLYNKYARNGSLNISSDSLGNLSYSQIEGPTLENSRGFKVNSDNYGDAHVKHEVQHLTVMSLEIHANTRHDLRPNPKFDPVTAIFYCIYNDVGISNEEEVVGMIVVDPISHHQTGQNSSETLKNYLLLCPGVKNGYIYCVENEIALFEKLVRIIREWDPDILVGYEIQMSSWGYLVERAEVLNINLRLLLSRLIDKNEAKLFPVEPDPTVTDQTADLSRLNIIGRIVLCVWRLMRKEVTLNIYSFENVYYHVLHKRTPLYAFQDLSNWFLGSQKEKVIRYYVIRVQGCIQFLEKLDVINRTSELARLFGIQFYEVLSRGSQFRVESMMLRTAATLSYIPVSPSVRQRSHSRAPECVPLILEPESRFYIDPVVVLDFQSLYPSMIIAYNYCFSTCLGRVEHFCKNVPFEFGCTSLSVPINLLQKLQNDIHVSPTGIAFVKSSIRRGILPSMLEEILNTRIMVKQSMKKLKENNALKKLLDARQLGLKLIANVTYGYTGATFSGRMPCVEVADSIVGKARETLERAIHMIENTSKWRAKVIYGDTDSLFILLPGRTKKQAFEIGQEIADAVTADNPKPVKLKFEKVYLPCVLQTKKRYVGFMYETIDQDNPVFDAKGIETVRRDSCPATAKILEKSLKILFKSYDVSLVKNYVQKQFTKLLNGHANIIDCIFAKEYRGISGYRPGACVPALEIAKKRLSKDPRSEPCVGERVPYVVVYGFPGLPIIQLVREPIELLRDLNLRINATYYITRVISPPLERVFNLLGADVKSWYTNLARSFKPTLPMTHTANQHKGTLSQYFVTLSCPSCEKPTFTAICDDCREDLQGTTIALNEKIRQWERTVDHLTQICGSCTKSASSINSCISLDCPMLFKLSAAKKDLSQAPYLRKVLANELF